MKTNIIRISVAITCLLLLLAAIRLHPYYHLAKEQIIGDEIKNSHCGDTLKVAFIGDSWAAYHNDSILDSLFMSQGRLCKATSIGIVGAKSREIYRRLYTTTKPLLKEHPSYCVVSAGINDAVAKLGCGYYVHHYMMIVKQLLELDVKPVLLEMPDVNYHAIAGKEPLKMRMRHILSSLITGSEMYGFDSYRTSLKQSIKQADWQSKVIYICASTWNPDGYMDSRNLYLPDETHLNAMGYKVLDSCIVSVILRDIGENQ